MKKYTIFSFLFDIIFGVVTGGIWWVYKIFKHFSK